MLLTSVTGRVPSQSMGNKGKSRFYTTSVATKAVLGDSHSVAARKFIQQGKGVYTVLPGITIFTSFEETILMLFKFFVL